MESRIFTASLKEPSLLSLFKRASTDCACGGLVKETVEMDLRVLEWDSNWVT